jgi:tetratricopeptide (TPR) repeat protein
VEIPGAVSMSLAPFDVSESIELVRLVAPEGNLSPSVIEQIVTRCEGNPLYLEETTRSVLETAREHGSEGIRATILREVPTTLQGLVQARLDRWPSAKPVIQAASVVGRDFTLPLLQRLLPERTDVPQAIALLVDRDVLVRDGDKPSGSIRFKHALIHDAVYRTVVRSERQRLHSMIADVLARELAGQAESAPDVLAHHLAAADRHQEATFAFAEASDLAAARAAHVESIGHSRAALALADHIPDERARRNLQRRVLINLGVSLAAIEGYASTDVLKTYHQARDLCAAQDDPAELFPVVRGLGTFHFVRGDILEADRLSDQCLALAQRAGRADLLIEALSFRGYPLHYRGNLAGCRRTLEECLAVYRSEHGQRFVYPSAQDAATAAWSLLITTRWLQGDALGAEAGTKELLSHVERLQRPFDEAYARVWIAGLCHLQRRLDDALHHASIAIGISHQYGFNTWLATSVMMASMATALRTASPEALETLRSTHREFMKAGAGVSASFYLWGLARALALSGQTQQAREALSEAIRRADASGETYLNPEILLTQAELETSEDRALACLREALRIADERGVVALALRAVATLVTRHGQHPDAELARATLRALDGEQPYPPGQDWMTSALHATRRMLAADGAARV